MNLVQGFLLNLLLCTAPIPASAEAEAPASTTDWNRWQVIGDFKHNPDDRSVTLTCGNSAALHRQVALSRPGHYVFRIHARSNARVAQMSVEGALDYDTEGTPFTAPYYGAFAIPLGRSDDFRTHEVPFVIENGSEPRTVTARINIKRGGGTMHLKSVEILRLGDTRQERRWGQNLPADPIHGLTTLNAAAHYDRPGFAAFVDTWTGAEVWLVSQGLKSRLQYPGTPNFTSDGKYFFLTSPGHVLRADGSRRYGPFKAKRIDSRYLPWPAKWMRDHLPSDRDSTDWMISEYVANSYGLTNVISGASATIHLPKRDGWRLVKMPSDEPGTFVNADTNHLCLWISNDRRRLAVSDSHGKQFREIKTKTESDDPTKDFLNDPFWSIDTDGHWYVSYILNWLHLHNSFKKTPENSINPGQIWMIRATPTIGQARKVIEGLKPGIKRRVLSDGTLVRRAENMGGGHKALDPTRELQIDMLHKTSAMAVQSLLTGEVWHLGNFPYLEHPEWVWHRDFGTARGDLRPLPLFFFDTRHQSMWPIVSMNYHDYGERLQWRRLRKPGKAVFFSGQATSPDGTKVAYASGMLSDNPASKADVYFAIARYPLPPVRLELEFGKGQKTTLKWGPPRYPHEIAGYHVYHTTSSGQNYRRITATPTQGTRYEISDDGFYVVTSVEHSGLESRAFSNEVSLNGAGPIRIYCEAEFSDFTKPLEPWFDQPTASNAYAVGILDRDLLYRARLREGLTARATQTVRIPKAGKYTIWARVKKRHPEESGRFKVSLNGTRSGEIVIDRQVNGGWSWVKMTEPLVQLPSDSIKLAFTTSDTGILVDQLLLSNTPDWTPPPSGNRPSVKPSTPRNLKIVGVGSSKIVWVRSTRTHAPPAKAGEDVTARLSWTKSAAPQGVTRYHVCRSDRPDFQPSQATLIGTTLKPSFSDVGLKDQLYYYRVVAEDNWRNRSEASKAAKVRIE